MCSVNKTFINCNAIVFYDIIYSYKYATGDVMNKTMVFALIILTMIIVASAFNMHLFPTSTPIDVPQEMLGQVLYVCPYENSTWMSIANGFRPFTKWIVMLFVFALIILAFVWGWALYQNLLKDKFVRDAFKTPWDGTKALFWAGVIVLMILMTPNNFKRVYVFGYNEPFVLCDNVSKGAQAIPADKVSYKKW